MGNLWHPKTVTTLSVPTLVSQHKKIANRVLAPLQPIPLILVVASTTITGTTIYDYNHHCYLLLLLPPATADLADLYYEPSMVRNTSLMTPHETDIVFVAIL